jgi:type II secretory ATPase GspE/PulE/Tfp pilus assembly ATPase PilB-like protein
MPMTDADLQKLLLGLSYLSAEDVKRADEQVKSAGVGFKQALFDLGLLTEELYEAALAEQSHLPFYSVEKNPPKAETVLLLPEDIARTYEAAVVSQDKGGYTIATSDPTRPLLEEAIRLNVGQQIALFPESEAQRKSSRKNASRFSFSRSAKEEDRKKFTGKITLVFAPRKAVESLFTHYRKPLATRFQKIIEGQRRVAPEILEEIFQDAINLKSSDIHFEPQEKDVVVRFRIDGVLHETGRIPKQYYEGVVNRVKIAANLHIDEHLKAQDGAIRYDTGKGNFMDIRVSIVPIVDGEKIVMRLLSEYIRTLTLQDLGFSARNRDILERASYKPFGMILTTGPTGSGKSTTLYALMKLRNHSDVNISTIEDPVEYKVPGINHIQVNPETDLTFAKGLRALMRQDPNIILVGEIRDGETASIAVNAALTGHLLFSTLHSNDAATAIPRLLEMGVEPFLLASTLEVIIAQRLVRRICPRCRYSYSLSRKDLSKLFHGAEHYFPGKGPAILYKGKGCEACGGIGYQGRVGVHELIDVTEDIENLIVARKSSADILRCARSQGMQTIFEDAVEKAKAGITTIEEVLRVSTPPESAHGK